MPDYRRVRLPGGTYFFTLVTYDRAPFLCEPLARDLLNRAVRECMARQPFVAEAWVLLPDHLHALWTLPDHDADFSRRWAAIKATFTRRWLVARSSESTQSKSRHLHRHRGVWQRRFWEHRIRDQEDFQAHLDYIHYNPVRHRLASCPHAWLYSTFAKWVKRGVYETDWSCACDGRSAHPPNFTNLAGVDMD